MRGEMSSLTRTEQATLARKVRAGGKAFEAIRVKLAPAVERYIHRSGFESVYIASNQQDTVWNALWSFLEKAAPQKDKPKMLLASIIGFLDLDRLRGLLGSPDENRSLPVEVDDDLASMVGVDLPLDLGKEDWDLVKEVQEGVRAFETIMNTFKAALLNYILVRVHVPDVDEQDISQLVWLAAWRKLAFEDSYNPDLGGIYCFLHTFLLRKEVAEALGRHRRKLELLTRLCQEWGLPSPGSVKETAIMPDQPAMELADAEVRAQAQEQLLCLLFRHGGYPHEILTVALGKGIHGLKTDRGIDADLDFVEHEYGRLPLKQVLETFGSIFRARNALPAPVLERVHKALDAVRQNLSVTFRELAETRVPKDTDALAQAPPAVLDQVTGESNLVAFAWRSGKSVGNQMFWWCENVTRRLRASLGCAKQTNVE